MHVNRKSIVRNNKGQGLASSVIGASLVGILIMSFYSLNKMQNKFKTKVDITNVVQNLRYDFYSAIKNKTANELSKTDPTNSNIFDCVNVGGLTDTCCAWNNTTQSYIVGGSCGVLDGSITLFDNLNSRPLSLKKVPGIHPVDGYSLLGEPCDTFDYVNGNDACPFRYEVSVSSKCSGINCTNPQIFFHAKLIFKPSPTNVELNNQGFLNVDDDPTTPSDYDFTILTDTLAAASVSQAKIRTFEFDICKPGETVGTDCDDPNVNLVSFWKAPVGVKKILVEAWGGGGGGAGGHFYSTDKPIKDIYQYLQQFYVGSTPPWFANDNGVGRGVNDTIPVRYFFSGGGGAGGGFASAILELDQDLGIYYKVVVGMGGHRGGANSDGGDGYASYIEGPYECALSDSSDCNTASGLRDPDNFSRVGTQFVIGFGGKRGKTCNNDNNCSTLNRQFQSEGKGGSIQFLPPVGTQSANIDPSIQDYSVSDPQIKKGGDGDVLITDSITSGGITNVAAGGPGGDMDEVHNAYYHPGNMKVIGTNAIHRIEFSYVPSHKNDAGEVALETTFQGVTYSQNGVGSGGSKTDRFHAKDLVNNTPSLVKGDFEDYINDVNNSGNYMKPTPGWHTEDGQHIKVTLMPPSHITPGYAAGYEIEFIGDFAQRPMELFKVKGMAGADCSVTNAGRPCFSFPSAPGTQNTLRHKSSGAPTTASIDISTLADGAFPNDSAESFNFFDDFAGLDGTLLRIKNPLNGNYDCVLYDLGNDGQSRYNMAIPTITGLCTGVLIKITGGDSGFQSGISAWQQDPNEIEDDLIAVLTQSPFSDYATWTDVSGVPRINVVYQMDAAADLPRVFVPNSSTVAWNSPSATTSNFAVTGAVGSAAIWQAVTVKSYVVTQGDLSNAQYHQDGDYFSMYYFGGKGGRAANGGSGGTNDFDNIGTRPGVPGGGGSGKMLGGCVSELFYDDNGSGVLGFGDWSNYSCETGPSAVHKRDPNSVMRGAPGRVIIYY